MITITAPELESAIRTVPEFPLIERFPCRLSSVLKTDDIP